MLDRIVARALFKGMGMGEEEMEETGERIDELFPESVEPVEREELKDFIHLDMALENPVWMFVWLGEPEREIDVRMTYADLKYIYDERMKKR